MSGFIVLYYGNTGSSWLIESIGKSPDVVVPAFEPLEAWAWQAPDTEKAEWMRNAFALPAERQGPGFDRWLEGLAKSPQFKRLIGEGFSTVGFKMTHVAFSDPAVPMGVLRSQGAKVIALVRNNRVKHAVSLYRHHEEGKTQFENKGTRPPTKLKLRVFGKWLRKSQDLHDSALVTIAELRRVLGEDKVLEIVYEDFVTEAGKGVVIAATTSFLGVEPPISLGQFEKATPDDLKSAVLNYNRLLRHLAGTEYERYLD